MDKVQKSVLGTVDKEQKSAVERAKYVQKKSKANAVIHCNH